MGRGKEKPLLRCPYDHADCFALIPDARLCYALRDVQFKQDCPFYKPETEVEPKYIIRNHLEDMTNEI